MTTYAHSLPGKAEHEWEPLSHHLSAVGGRAAGFAEIFGWGAAAGAAGLLHDIGKVSQAYQAYIRQPRDGVGWVRGPDHSTAGAREARSAYPGALGRILAFAIAGHHAGLADGGKLDERLAAGYLIKDYPDWRDHTGPTPAAEALRPTTLCQLSVHAGFSEAFLTRMLFSCLVDADFLETERFYAQAEGREVERGGHVGLDILRERLFRYMDAKRSDDTPVNSLRARVLDHAVAQAAKTPGLFTLTVPTGGGKTLASLSFALEHAVRHGMKRVIYVIPFTSIIEQTAEVFRTALDTRDDVLEHHASFDWEQAGSIAEADDEGPAGLAKLRKAAENWDAPVVVTTAVQFFESLFASRTSRCRKLHNLAGAVIVLDEAQSLPLHVLRPCLAALDELARNYGASIVLCTATQPALRLQDRKLYWEKRSGERVFEGLNIPDDHELAPNPPALYEELRRVDVEVRPDKTDDAVIVERFAANPQMLCIVNSRAHARTLYDAMATAGLEGAVHLSTLMCPVHRSAVLTRVRAALAAGQPARVVSTSLIEAGVDISFPEVWRASTGLDSIVQAAGRCNRNDELKAQDRKGRMVVFTPASGSIPPELELAQRAAAAAFRQGHDPLGPEIIAAYFGQIYGRKDFKDLDRPTIPLLGVEVQGVLNAIARGADGAKFPFSSISERFKLIEEIMTPVIVPYDEIARQALGRVARDPRPARKDLQILQRYTVSLPRRAHADWLERGVIVAVRPDLKDPLTRLDDVKAHYRDATGVDLVNALQRAAEANVIS